MRIKTSLSQRMMMKECHSDGCDSQISRFNLIDGRWFSSDCIWNCFIMRIN